MIYTFFLAAISLSQRYSDTFGNLPSQGNSTQEMQASPSQFSKLPQSILNNHILFTLISWGNIKTASIGTVTKENGSFYFINVYFIQHIFSK